MSGAKYDVVSLTVEALLAQPTAQFRVPPFQRKYAWGGEEISQLIDDLYGELSYSDLPYFLGSIVLARQESGPEPVPDLVLDGQQRLTTLSLLVSVLVYKMRESGVPDADWNKMYLFSRKLQGKKTPKVLLQPDDEKVFKVLIDAPERFAEPQLKGTLLSKAVRKIFLLVDEYASKGQYKDSPNPYEQMLSRLIYQVELVRITAPSERDAFRLFETLNDRGLDLSAADLIKNKLFSRCKDELEDAVEAWTNLLLTTQDDDVVNFLRSYWIAFKGFVRKRELYDAYKNDIDRLDPTSATIFILDLESAAKLYKQIVTPTITKPIWGVDVAEGLDRLANSYHARICRPTLLGFSQLRPTDMKKAVRLCESITVRYSVAGEKNPNRLEWLYAEICNHLRLEGDPWVRFLEDGMFNEIPDDDEFRLRMATIEISTITSGWREVLIHLNKGLGQGEAELGSPTRVHVEHILPQKPRATALTEAGMSQEQAKDLINRLGNLTLLLGQRNQKLSNRPFSEKRVVYADSDVFLTRELSTLERWSADEIEKRSLRLAEAAVKLFPHPKKIAEETA